MANPASGSDIVDIYNELESDKGTLRAHLQEIADYMVPSAQRAFTQATIGGKRMSKIYDGTAMRSLDMFANGLYGHLTNPSFPWFELTTKDKGLAEFPKVKFWLMDTTERMRNAINSSNAQVALHEIYFQEGWIGGGVMLMEAGSRYFVNFQTFNAINCCLTEDNQGVVDGLYRLEKFTARGAIQRWGDKCSKAITDAYKANKMTQTFDIIIAVYPRNDYDWRKWDSLNMPYASVCVERETRNVLNEGGYKEFPYACPRWSKEDNSPYGVSPAMKALPDVKMLNQMRYDNLRGLQRLIDPPLTANKETAVSTTNTPVGKIIFSKSGSELKPLVTGARFDWALESERDTREMIEKAFYTDLFMLLAQSNDMSKTAYEVRQLLEEKLTLLGPALGRQQTELFDPMLSRVLFLLAERGAILPPPKELYNQGLEVNYIGRLALAMKQFETQAAGATLSFVSQIAQVAPEVMDNFDFDEMAHGTAQRAGMPVKYLRPPESRDNIRAARAKAQTDNQTAATMIEAAKVVPGISKAPEPGSLAEAIVQ